MTGFDSGWAFADAVLERRLRAVLEVLRGADEARVARELEVEPSTVLRWCDLFLEGGRLRLSGTADPVSCGARDHFLVLLARELLRPLDSIEGAVSGADSRIAGPVMVQVRHLREVASQVLTASKVAVGDLPLAYEPVSLRRLAAEEALAEPGRGITLQAGDDVIVIADEERLRGAFRDLVGVAADLVGAAGINICVSVQGSYGRVDVITGRTDLSALQARQLLEPDPITPEALMAARLFSCRTLVAAHRGEVGVSHEDGMGTLWLRVPVDGPLTYMGDTKN